MEALVGKLASIRKEDNLEWLMKKFLVSGDTFVDVGANKGEYSFYALVEFIILRINKIDIAGY